MGRVSTLALVLVVFHPARARNCARGAVVCGKVLGARIGCAPIAAMCVFRRVAVSGSPASVTHERFHFQGAIVG
jgi:hypothetical protein